MTTGRDTTTSVMGSARTLALGRVAAGMVADGEPAWFVCVWRRKVGAAQDADKLKALEDLKEDMQCTFLR